MPGLGANIAQSNVDPLWHLLGKLYARVGSKYCSEQCGLTVVSFKGSDRLCKVVELSMQCCGKLLSDSFETY